VTQQHEVSKHYWENGANRLALCRAATDFQFVKNTMSVKCNKAMYNKMGMPVLSDKFFFKPKTALK